MSTRPPVSTPLDHAAWEKERKRLESASIDAGGAVVKISDPILDSRWAVIFGGTLWVMTLGVVGWMSTTVYGVSTKLDTLNEKLTQQTVEIGQQSAGQRVLEIRFNALQQTVDRSLASQDARIERLERR